jgi:hypothetical protein
MPTDLPQLPSDAQLLYEYLGKRIESGDEHRPAIEVIAELNAYRQQLERLRSMVAEAEESLAQGRVRELDVEALLDRVRRRIPSRGDGAE